MVSEQLSQHIQHISVYIIRAQWHTSSDLGFVVRTLKYNTQLLVDHAVFKQLVDVLRHHDRQPLHHFEQRKAVDLVFVVQAQCAALYCPLDVELTCKQQSGRLSD